VNDNNEIWNEFIMLNACMCCGKYWNTKYKEPLCNECYERERRCSSNNLSTSYSSYKMIDELKWLNYLKYKNGNNGYFCPCCKQKINHRVDFSNNGISNHKFKIWYRNLMCMCDECLKREIKLRGIDFPIDYKGIDEEERLYKQYSSHFEMVNFNKKYIQVLTFSNDKNKKITLEID